MELKMFVLPGCPYCRQADKIINQLMESEPNYREIEINKINELTNRKLVKDYDYYYAPTFFVGMEKMYEANPGDNEEIMRGKIEHMFAELLVRDRS